MYQKIKILVCFLYLLSACSSKELSQDTLFVVLDSKPNTLDPRKATDANGMRLVSLIFSGLVQSDAEGLIPDSALKWELKGLSYTFYLKPNLRFSNGRLVSKQDILFSFEEFRKKGSPFYSAFKNIKSVKVLVKKKDPVGKTQMLVKIFLKKFQAPFLHADLQVIKILPKKEILESPKEFYKKPFGSGDFELVKNSFHQILLKRRAPDQKISLKYISFQIIRDSFTRTQKMLSGEVDIAPSVIPLQKISQFQRQKKKFYISSRPGLSTTYLLINLRNKLLKKKKLRQALSFSLNREEIIKYKMKNYAFPARSFINPENYFFNRKLKKIKFNLNKARQIIDKIGLKGAQFQLSTSNNKDTVNKAKVLIGQISQAGLKLNLQSNEWGVFYKDVGRGAYDLALMKWVGVVDPDIYRIAFHSENESPKGRNRSFYKNKKLDKLLEEGLRAKNKKRRKQIYDRIQQLIAKDFIVIPLWHDMEISVLKTNIKNYHLRQNGDFLSLPLVKKSF